MSQQHLRILVCVLLSGRIRNQKNFLDTCVMTSYKVHLKKTERPRFCHSSTVQWSEKLAGVVWIAQEKLSNLSGKRASQATLTFVQYILHVMEASPFG